MFSVGSWFSLANQIEQEKISADQNAALDNAFNVGVNYGQQQAIVAIMKQAFQQGIVQLDYNGTKIVLYEEEYLKKALEQAKAVEK